MKLDSIKSLSCSTLEKISKFIFCQFHYNSDYYISFKYKNYRIFYTEKNHTNIIKLENLKSLNVSILEKIQTFIVCKFDCETWLLAYRFGEKIPEHVNKNQINMTLGSIKYRNFSTHKKIPQAIFYQFDYENSTSYLLLQ